MNRNCRGKIETGEGVHSKHHPWRKTSLEWLGKTSQSSQFPLPAGTSSYVENHATHSECKPHAVTLAAKGMPRELLGGSGGTLSSISTGAQPFELFFSFIPYLHFLLASVRCIKSISSFYMTISSRQNGVHAASHLPCKETRISTCTGESQISRKGRR